MSNNLRDKLMSMNLIKQLKTHEGFRSHSYCCSEGVLTIGYGYSLSANPLRLSEHDLQAMKTLGISQVRAEQLLKAEVARLTKEIYQRLPWIVRLNEARQAVILGMSYNLGIEGLMKFKRTLNLIEHEQFDNAADAMLQSKWSTQVKGRALELSTQMRTGKYV
jgi:lysozyme